MVRPASVRLCHRCTSDLAAAAATAAGGSHCGLAEGHGWGGSWPSDRLHRVQRSFAPLRRLTTVGYGDESPVTGEGRLIAVLLMIGGIGLVGTVTATLASWIVQRVAQEDNQYQVATAAQIKAPREDARLQMVGLRDEIQQLKEVVASQQQPPTPHAHRRALRGSAALGNGNRFVEASSTDGHRIWCPVSPGV